MNAFSRRFVKIAASFLQTVVVLDDRAYRERTPPVKEGIRPPSRRQSDRGEVEEREGAARRDPHDLDVEQLVTGFAKVGLLCSAMNIEPRYAAAIDGIAERCDIVVLDWQVRDDDGANDNGAFALDQLNQIYMRDRLSLVAIYTGEQDISNIVDKISEAVVENGGQPLEVIESGLLRRGNCCIALYCKPYTLVADEYRGRIVEEADLGGRLIEDFAICIAGLLPAIVLSALAAIRNSSYRVLERFDRRLDPAFLAHRACLQAPDDAESFVVSKIAGELAAIVDDTIRKEQPAGWDMIAAWLDAREETIEDIDKYRDMLRCGTEVALEMKGVKQKARYRWFAEKLTGSDDEAQQINEEFAWLASYRAVVDGPPKLHAGTVLHESKSDLYLVCITPRCDSVRLRGATTFLFLEMLDEPGKWKMMVRSAKDQFLLRTVARRPVVRQFDPDKSGEVVGREEQAELLYFVDCDGTRYDWLGELKPEFAQRLVHRLGYHLSRVPAEETEWLRRMEREG